MLAATTRSPSSGRPVWPAIHETFGPSSAAAASSTSGLRAVMSTWAPASANALAMPLPIPFEPPVTIAALPSSRSSIAATVPGAPTADELASAGHRVAVLADAVEVAVDVGLTGVVRGHRQ